MGSIIVAFLGNKLGELRFEFHAILVPLRKIRIYLFSLLLEVNYRTD